MDAYSHLCGFCEHLAHFTFVWGHTHVASGQNLVNFAALCDHCGFLSIASAEHTYGGYENSTDPARVKYAIETTSSLEWWPKVGQAPTVEDVPASIARAAREAYSSASVGNDMAAILMARTVVEATAKSKNIDGKNLATKINAMRDANLIRPAIAEQAHEVRFAGNDMAHGDIDVEPDATDAEEILALMTEVLREVFQGPAALERIRAKRLASP
jgi:hypothetical protein